MPRQPSLQEIRAELERRQSSKRPAGKVEPTSPEATRTRCRSLAQFVREAWPILEPDTPLVWGWHLDAICEHLEAITFGTFRKMGLRNRLLINVPPGSSKSMIVSVMWMAWEWSFTTAAGVHPYVGNRYLMTAYNGDPVQRDTMKVRDLILSDWYQRNFPHVTLRNKGDTKLSNTRTGTRVGSAFGSLTSKRGNRFILDDPHSTELAESDVERDNTTRKFREGAINRLNNQSEDAIVIIMQRLHAKDISGVVMKMGGYIHLMIPMEYEPERKCITPIWEDPRTELGELMDPVRFPREVVEAEFKSPTSGMGSYAFAGQYQQRPSPREGGLFKRAWFVDKIIRQAPPGTVWCRGWDLGATAEQKADPSAGVKLGRAPNGAWIVGHSLVTREEGDTVRQLIKATAQSDGLRCQISIPQDPGQAGKVQAADYIKFLAGYIVRCSTESGDKVQRAEPFSVQCEGGNVYLVEGTWNEPYLDELCAFPGGHDHDDQVDASSRAFGQLILTPASAIVAPILVTGGPRTYLGDHPGA